MQPTRFFYICNNTHSTLGTEEVLKGVCVWGGGGGGGGGFHDEPRLPNARELLRGSMASSIYCKKKNCHFVNPGVWTREKGPVEILLLWILYHHGLLAVYGKKEIRHVLHVCHMICNNRGFPVGDAAVSVLSVRLSFLIQEWDTNDIENKFNYLVVCNFGPGLAQRTNPTF